MLSRTAITAWLLVISLTAVFGFFLVGKLTGNIALALLGAVGAVALLIGVYRFLSKEREY